MQTIVNPWDKRAVEYAEWVARREREGVEGDAILACLLDLLGDVAGRDVLDAAAAMVSWPVSWRARRARDRLDLSPA